MATDFSLILFMAGFGVVAALPMIIIPFLFAPKKPDPVKLQTFEAGQSPVGESRVHLMMQYYSYLLLFVVMDVLAIFLFAWGVVYASLGLPSVIWIMVFLGIMFIPMGYILQLAGRRELW